ncbi:MAG: transcription antitermination factor NusB [Armatimonadetes bacterium]|nr:transcription antitermination factor NusB [Armatimonadota bacterium]
MDSLSSRRAGREAILQAIFQMEVARIDPETATNDILDSEQFDADGDGSEDSIKHLLAQAKNGKDVLAYVQESIAGIGEHQGELDERCKPLLAHGWEWNRIAIIDRCLLRMAAYEFWHRPEIPPKVTINEAVVLAHKFGARESSKFVNGLLGKLLSQSPKAEWDPTKLGITATEELVESTLSAPEEEVVQEGSAEYQEMVAASPWKIRSQEPEEVNG